MNQRKDVQFLIVPPSQRRRSWDVHAFSGRGLWKASWYCDSEAIAKLVAKRLRKGQSPGCVARDVRMGIQ